MAEIDDLYSALEKADAAGNAGDAREIANHIRALESAAPSAGEQPTRAAPAAQADPAGVERNAQGQVIEDLDKRRSGEAFLTNAADSLTFGAASPIAAYLAATGSKLTNNPISYKEARANQIAHQEALDRENPSYAMAGSLAGSVVGGLGIAKAAKAVLPGAVRAVTPQAADSTAKIAGRLALGGSVAGAGSNIAETGVDIAERELGGADTVSRSPVSDAIVAGGLGGVAGPVVGGLVGGAVRAAGKGRDLLEGNTLGGGWRYLARKLDVEPETLRGAMDDYARLTGGQRPSIAQVMDMKQQGVLAELGRDKAAAGVVFHQAAEEGAEALPGQVREQVARTVGRPRSADEVELATRQPADRFMADVRSRGDSTFLTQGDIQALRTRDFISATRDLPPELRSRVAGALNGQEQLTTSELDLLRRHVAEWGEAGVANKGPSQAFQTTLADIAERTSPGYRDNTIRATEAGKLREKGFGAGLKLDDNTGVMGGTLRQGTELEGYGEGVARRVWSGAGGGPRGAASAAEEVASSRNMQDALDSAYGAGPTQELVEGSRALVKGQRALDTIDPGRVRAAPNASAEARELTDVAGGVVAAGAGHPVSMTRQLMRMLPGGIDERVAGRIADNLVSTDPARVRIALENLRRAGLNNAGIAEAQSLAARVAGDRIDPRRERRPLEVTVRKRAGQ